MRKLKLKILLLVLILVAGACSEKESFFYRFDSTAELLKSLSADQTISWMVRLPRGTTFKAENGMVNFYLPTGYKMMGYDATTNQLVSVKGYTCTCSDDTKKCQSFIAGDMVGCATSQTDPCPKCTGTNSSLEKKSMQQFDMLYLIHPEEATEEEKRWAMSWECLIPIRQIRSVKELIEMPMIDQTDLHSEVFVKALKTVIEHTFPNGFEPVECNVIPKGTSLFAMQYNGKKFFLLGPSEAATPGIIELLPMFTNIKSLKNDEEMDAAGKVYCSGCSGKCKVKSEYGGLLKYCDGCPSGCTIHY